MAIFNPLNRIGQHHGIAPSVLAMMLYCYVPLTQAQEFDTLFTSADEREYLDYLRQDFVTRRQLATFNIEEDIIPDIPEPEVVVEVEIINYQFGGIMTRINGNKMIWLNGRQVAESVLPSNFSLVNTATGFLLNINANGNSYQLKPGQSIDMQSYVISEPYQRVSIPINATDSSSSNSPNSNTSANATDTNLNPEPSTGLDSSSVGFEEEIIPVVAEQEPGDIGAILEQLNLNEQNLDSESRNNALNILTEQLRDVQ